MTTIKSFLKENMVLILSLAFSTLLAVLFLMQLGCTDSSLAVMDAGQDTAEDAFEMPDTAELACEDQDSGVMCVDNVTDADTDAGTDSGTE